MILRILIAQINLRVGDVAANRDRVLAVMAEARDQQGADLVVFPELTLTGYPPEDLLLRPELLERVVAALEEIRAASQGIGLVLGYPKRDLGSLFNVAGFIYDGRLLAEYAKQRLPNYSVFDEKRYFQAGHAPAVVDFKGVPLGLLICEDIWEEGPTTQAVEGGARLLINLNASPYHTGKAPEREDLLTRRAREHQVPILYANLVGGQDELVFDGGSFVVDAAGQLTQRAPFFSEALMLVEVEAETKAEEQAAAKAGGGGVAGRLGLRPLPAAIAPHPAEEEAVYQALVLGVRDYARKNGFHGAVLGLSGGIDSALTLAIAVDALGADQVEAVLMPSRYTATMSIDDALAQARTLEVAHRLVPIEPAFQAFLGMLEGEFAGCAPDVTEENIQARCRGIVLMAISNKKGKILLTTGNKSEVAVGYATLYGDMAGGFAPIKDVPKTQVYRLAAYRNTLGPKAIIPQRVIDRPPSAELRENQTDQDSLPDYAVLDPILKRYVEEDESVARIVAAGFPEELVRRVTRLVDRNEYKRRQAPPGVRITTRAFGRDRRYPITSGF
jgi:NAD+ synthase (glutamine-hydrolysing)